MKFKRRYVLGSALGALATLTLAAALPSFAQSEKLTKLILPFAAGSGVDVITRASSKSLAAALGGAVVIDNQPGAGGIVGTSALVKSAPDGATLSVVSNNHVIYPSVYKSLPFDPINDITPIAVMGTTPMVLVVHPKVSAQNSKDLIALLKAKPDAMNYASSGNGTILHLAAEMFLDEAGVKAKHIPYKGVGPMITDLIGGQVEFGVLALPAIQAHLKSGALRAIGTSSKARLAAAPEIPTFAEQGLPGYLVEGWFAVIGPKNLPAAEVKRVHAAFTSAFASAEVKETMNKQGNNIAISTPEAATAFFKSEMEKYAKLVKMAGVKLD
ncbi:MAG: tripartite tricarboxylate transporter substrate binding protein [Burkholderiales bacterium]|nr:tripartite tricarboxylate transporter substrate binding protein [Burkholderiales bacterium]